MGVFRKKKNDDSRYSNRKAGSLLTAFDRMVYTVVKDCSEQEMFEISNNIIAGKPVLANFDKVDAKDANNMLSFISGVVYASKGEIFKLSSRLFLFGNKEAYEDGSLHQYVEDTK